MHNNAPDHILCIKILCDDEVKSPIISLVHSVVQMCAVRPLALLSASNPKPREVVQLDATIGAVCSSSTCLNL